LWSLGIDETTLRQLLFVTRYQFDPGTLCYLLRMSLARSQMKTPFGTGPEGISIIHPASLWDNLSKRSPPFLAIPLPRHQSKDQADITSDRHCRQKALLSE
jgi:hypothetical protein